MKEIYIYIYIYLKEKDINKYTTQQNYRNKIFHRNFAIFQMRITRSIFIKTIFFFIL